MGTDTRKHLRRLARVWVPDPIYFVTTCVRRPGHMLASPDVVDILLAEWRESYARYGWQIGSFVVMPDHVHFFCRLSPGGASLSVCMEKWKEWTAKRINVAFGRRGPLWQEGFFDHVLRSRESYTAKKQYVRRNPVRAGLVTRTEDWPFRGHVHFA
ncbi:MAG: REP-associated tyrosine transposase [bacterium]